MCVVVFAFVAHSAFTADSPINAPIFSWSNCFAGFNAGHAWANAKLEGPPNTAFVIVSGSAVVSALQSMVPTAHTNGFIRGIGCDVHGNLVLVRQSDINYTNHRSSTFPEPFPTLPSGPPIWEMRIRQSSFGTARAPFGFAPTRTHLLSLTGGPVYLLGGLAYGDFAFAKALNFTGFDGISYAESDGQNGSDYW